MMKGSFVTHAMMEDPTAKARGSRQVAWKRVPLHEVPRALLAVPVSCRCGDCAAQA